MSKAEPQKVHRLDSIPLDKTYFTEEGYLVDHPIVTSVGIFVYHNPDGTERRELRLPEEGARSGAWYSSDPCRRDKPGDDPKSKAPPRQHHRL